jgi:hypothetical protein
VFGSYQLAFVVSAASAATTVLIYLLLGPYRFAVRPPQAAQPQGPAGEEKALTAV